MVPRKPHRRSPRAFDCPLLPYKLLNSSKSTAMVDIVSRIDIVSVVFIAVAYQFLFKSVIFDTMGYGRKVLSINKFKDFRCEKIDELGLEGCEDMWLHEPTGFLYMACSDSQSRTQ